ncbi:two-component system response regulator [Methylomonas rosea]|uniref:EAL domain-containing protein n=1 Tax=Methylomonas rosea TaxID=2952227 RepID=A0ABT1TRD1_9GAMM|nr:EAL domain-containing protein [Methylomonas sp. WSC-7]MCQ8117329.1 EAL domain-containing protein [Methylomonas sp. WSC-7]
MERLPARSLILAIDDDDMVRLMLQEILQREEFDVICAANGKQGLALAASERPNLVLLDVMLPDLNGFDCLQAIKNMPGNSLLPVVMLTGMDDLESVNRAFQLGATDFIPKPLNWPTLPHRLRYLLRSVATLEELARSEAELRQAQKIAQLGSWYWSVADDHMQWSEEVFNILGTTRSSFEHKCRDLYKSVHPSEVGKLQQAMDLCVKNQRSFRLELPVTHHDGGNHVIHIQGKPVVDDEQVSHIHGTLQDITERRDIEERVRLLSYYDPLTGLPNRTLFKEVLAQAMSYCTRYGTVISTLFISIDRFKRINETLGPKIGDQVLKLFAERLLVEVRDCDYISINADYDFADMTVSRLGGNEFTVLLNHIEDTRDSVKVAKRIFHAMQQAFPVDNTELFLGISIGIAVYPGDGQDEDSFIKNGEFAMNHASEHGHNNYQFFSKSLNVAAFHKLAMENSLRRAIERDELQLYYQAKINIRHQQVVGCEALIRWQHPELGLIGPSQFIPIAEDSGLIAQISDWVLENASRQALDWQQSGLCQGLVMAVNVSATQFRQYGFGNHVREVLSNIGLEPRYLKLELTETILLDHIDDALITLRELQALGVKISIDDFGTGYSSLSYLKKLPISELKVDHCFVRDLPHNEDDMAITAAILALADALSLEVVAEGVENEDQANFLLDSGCEVVQGFLYNKPMPAGEFAAFVVRFNSRTLITGQV